MYTIPKNIKKSVVYKGMRTDLGAKTANYLLKKMFKDGYVLDRCLSMHSGCFETPDVIRAKLIFTKDAGEYLVTVFWTVVGRKDTLKEIYSIKEMEVERYEVVQTE